MSDLEQFCCEMLPHLDALRWAARRLAPADADDLLQETFARALAARNSYRAGSNARGWLYRILCNVALSEHRRRARQVRLCARLGREPTPPLDDEPSQPMPGLDELQRALAGLSTSERRIIELADVEGLRYRDVARALDCPMGTVMSRLHRARRRLRARLQPREIRASG
jgi:RNA polymerase sigma-70 factor (ECF subfamily)